MIQVRQAELTDVAALWHIEQRCFAHDRLSRRRIRYYLDAPQAEMVVAVSDQQLLGYALLLVRRGTQLTRLYSIAVLPEARGQQVAQRLISELTKRALARGKRFMRLEVSTANASAIRLYERLGFKQFGLYQDYYEDHSDALRMQKVLIPSPEDRVAEQYPWYRQTTEFTCGPASLMMAMTQLRPAMVMEQTLELAIWRRATTIFMTSGHGGCHPLGLALAALDHGFRSSVWLSPALPLFVESVRNANKKAIVRVVEENFEQEARTKGIDVVTTEWREQDIAAGLAQGAAVICLISTYAFDKRKAPHWVVITGMDHNCYYLHDPDPEDEVELIEFQHMPVAREDFLRLASYGKRRVRAAVLLWPEAVHTNASELAMAATS